LVVVQGEAELAQLLRQPLPRPRRVVRDEAQRVASVAEPRDGVDGPRNGFARDVEDAVDVQQDAGHGAHSHRRRECVAGPGFPRLRAAGHGRRAGYRLLMSAHAHGHRHHHHDDGSLRSLTLALVLNAAYTVVEVVAALFAGSLTLLADAGHNLSD